MTLFTILMPSPQPALASVIREKFPNDHFRINDTQWLVSSGGTVTDLCAKLGIYDAKEPESKPTGVGVVFAVTSYFGRAPSTVWDWIKVKLEGQDG